MAVLGASPRTRLVRLIVLGAVLTAVLTLYTSSSSYSAFLPSFPSDDRSKSNSTCSPADYAAGFWTPRTLNVSKTEMTRMDDVLEFAGFEGCASSREYYWHLGADRESIWDRFPGAMEWEWTPSSRCTDLKPLQPADLVMDMILNGGWLLIGDSVTENHFFSLSCVLYPHVRATPNYNENPNFDRAWPQHLYLSPSSPLLTSGALSLPPDFSIEKTPLVTFRRVDLLLDRAQLESLYATEHPDMLASGKGLFSEEQFWSLSPEFYTDLFLAPRSRDGEGGGYSTMVISTAGHWTTTQISAFRDDSEGASAHGYGIQGVLDFFAAAMRVWAADVQGRLDAHFAAAKPEPFLRWGRKNAVQKQARHGDRGKRVVVRAYLPGHEDCHDYRQPWAEWQPYRWNWYNWASIGDFNRVFQDILASPQYPDIHFLPIDRPALLRPDAHSASDCLHIMSGAGVLEGWTQYISHYVSREL